jgi:hypothetical protein
MINIQRVGPMPGKQAKILSENQCSLLISFLSTSRHPLRNRVIALLSIKAGLRAAEISKLDCQIASNTIGALSPDDSKTKDDSETKDYSRTNDDPKAKATGCQLDWTKCSDNEDVVNNYGKWSEVEVDCKMQAEKQARYGTPVWPWLAFGSFYKGTNYVSSGIAVVIEPDAQFQNGFGAMVHSQVECTYDLGARRAISVDISPR